MNDTTHIQTETPPENGEAGRLLARPLCSAFSVWWDDTGQHLPQNNLELAQDAWNAALGDAEKCIVPDGNPMVALDKIKRLKI